MDSVADNLAGVRDAIAESCRRAGRPLSGVELVAVSKTVPVEWIREAAEAGQRLFGESRQQEAEEKIGLLPADLRWHFIGPLQRNKVRKVLPNFELVHSIDSLRLASYADSVAAETGAFPKVLIEVNVAGEAAKCGFGPEELFAAFEEMLGLKRLEILGLMTIPPPGEDAEDSRRWFVKTRELRDRLQETFGVALPCLSMGMSGDYTVAVEEGATLVRVGSAIFGSRPRAAQI